MTIMEAISKNLNKIINDRRLTIKLLSKMSNVSETTIRNIINCKVNTINTRTAVKLANALFISFDDFLKNTEYETKKK